MGAILPRYRRRHGLHLEAAAGAVAGGGYGPGYGYGRGTAYGPGYGYRRGYGGGGGSCLRDLLLLDAGCCLAEMIGCGNNLFLVAPSTLRHVHADGSAAHGRLADRMIAAVRVYQREISPKRPPVCHFTRPARPTPSRRWSSTAPGAAPGSTRAPAGPVPARSAPGVDPVPAA